LQEAAAKIGLLLPQPVRSVSGAVVESIQDHNWRVNAWIESGPPLAAPVSKSIAAQAGSILARLHALALPPDRPMEPWYRPLKAADDWAALASRASAERMSWAATLETLLSEMAELTHMCATVDPPTTTILCHCGFGPHSTRVTREGQLSLLGWEHAGAFPPSWELANAIMAWTVGQFGDRPSRSAASALLDAYRKESGQLPALDVRSFSASVSGWLNYVYGQICIALDTKSDEERQFMGRHVSHLLAHAPSRAFLDQVLDTVA
jgi:Ser/Thr protein kinase RdoA (MazF antagonist)